MKKTLPLLCALLFAGALLGPAARAADYTNSIGMAFKDIPAGHFYMGSCWLSEADREINKKQKAKNYWAAAERFGLPLRDRGR